jgi:hypothetical protein
MNYIHGFYLLNGSFDHSILVTVQPANAYEDSPSAATEYDPENWTEGHISGLFSNSELSL